MKLARLFDFTLDRKEGHCSQWIVLDYSRCLQRSEREEGSLHIVADSALLVARFTVTFVLAARRSLIIAGFACVRLLACLSSLVRCEHISGLLTSSSSLATQDDDTSTNVSSLSLP